MHYFFGKVVPGIPRLSYFILRRRKSGHGHLVVYELVDDSIFVLQFYHTAQDWQEAVADEIK